MTQLLTNLHYETFKDLDFDIPYYYHLCQGKKVIELCAGFGRVCNKLHLMGIDITAIEKDRHNFDMIELPKNRAINDNIFNQFDQQHIFDVLIAPFNSFPIFSSNHESHLFFELISKLLDKNGIASLSYYHPNDWRIIPASENSININGIEFEYTSNYDLSKRATKHATWEDIFTNKADHSKNCIKYDLKVYENIEDLNNICNLYGLECRSAINDFYDVASYEPGWIEYQLFKVK